MAKLKQPDSIPLYMMRSGQVAIVREWPNNTELGKIVQRCDNTLFIIGEDDCYPILFTSTNDILKNYRVSILPSGTEIVL